MPKFPIYCDDEDCGCPCYDYCKDKMLGVDHFSCESVYYMYKEDKKMEEYEEAMKTIEEWMKDDDLDSELYKDYIDAVCSFGRVFHNGLCERCKNSYRCESVGMTSCTTSYCNYFVEEDEEEDEEVV